MSRRQLILAGISTVAIVIIAIISGIVIRRDMGMLRTECELYFMNEAGTSIASEVREIKHSDPNRLPGNVIIQLLKGPENSKLNRLINRNTKLLGLDNVGGKIVVDFSRDFLDKDSARNMQAVYSVVKSLCSIDNVYEVKVTVEGSAIQTSDGGGLGYLSSEDINLPTDPNTIEVNDITLYFRTKDSDKLHKTVRSVKVADQQPLEYYIVSGLIKGPEEKGSVAVLSKDTELLSVDTEGDICFVNMNSNFIEKNAGEKGKYAIYSIVNSLTELDNINRVQFLIEGKKVHKFGDMDIFGIYERNREIIG